MKKRENEKDMWIIPVSWTMTGYVRIAKADCPKIQDAIDLVQHPEQPLPDEEDSFYLEDSFKVDDEESVHVNNPEIPADEEIDVD
jgi:hypothetical protein